VQQRVYMTEDLADGAFYRYTPRHWPDLSSGLLEVATVRRRTGDVTWTEVPDPSARNKDTRFQVRGSSRFKRGEGIWYDEGTVYISTTYDGCVRAYVPATQHMSVIYDGFASPSAPLIRVDQMTASPAGEVFICEDISLSEIPMGVLDRGRRMTRFLAVTGKHHENSELTGVAFTPDSTRMYFSSQRAYGHGAIYEVTGPFHSV
jgi:secreted PhoX family phosphatase